MDFSPLVHSFTTSARRERRVLGDRTAQNRALRRARARCRTRSWASSLPHTLVGELVAAHARGRAHCHAMMVLCGGAMEDCGTQLPIGAHCCTAAHCCTLALFNSCVVAAGSALPPSAVPPSAVDRASRPCRAVFADGVSSASGGPQILADPEGLGLAARLAFPSVLALAACARPH